MRYYNLAKEVTEVHSITKYKLYEDEKVLLKLDLPYKLDIIDKDIAVFTMGSYGDDIDKRKDVIFNLEMGKVINDKFNKIYSFKDYNGMRIARADIYVKYKDKIITLSCLIDTLGNILSKVIDDKDLNPFDKSILDKHIEYLYKCLIEEDQYFNNLLKVEEDKVAKLVLQKIV